MENGIALSQPKNPLSLGSANAVVLAIDPAKTSGVAIFDQSELIAYGAVTDAWEREAVCKWVSDYSKEREYPKPVVFAEKFYRGKGMSAQSMFGLGRMYGQWTHCLDLNAVGDRRRYRMYPSGWQKLSCGVNRDKKSVQWVNAEFDLELSVEEHDVADAICIGVAGMRSEEYASLCRGRKQKRVEYCI